MYTTFTTTIPATTLIPQILQLSLLALLLLLLPSPLQLPYIRTLTLSKETEALARALSSCSTGTLVRLELRNRNHLNTNTITNISHTAVVIYIKQCSIVHPFPFIMSRTPYSLVLLPLLILYYSCYYPYPYYTTATTPTHTILQKLTLSISTPVVGAMKRVFTKPVSTTIVRTLTVVVTEKE